MWFYFTVVVNFEVCISGGYLFFTFTKLMVSFKIIYLLSDTYNVFTN